MSNHSLIYNNTYVNATDVPEDDFSGYSLYGFVTIEVLCLLLFTAGIFGNMVIMIVICRTNLRHSRVKRVFLNLVVADLLMLVIYFVSCFASLVMKRQSQYWNAICHVTKFLEEVNILACNMTILYITLGRFKGISRPLTFQSTWNRHQILGIILVIWGVAAVTCVPIIYMTFEKEIVGKWRLSVQCDVVTDTTLKISYILIVFLTFYVLILFMLVYLTVEMISSLIRQCRTLKRSKVTQTYISRRWRIVFTLILVNLTFVLCLFPDKLMKLWAVYAQIHYSKSPSSPMYQSAFLITHSLVFVRSTINPVIYNCTSTSFRTAVFNFACCRRDDRYRFNRTTSTSVKSFRNQRFLNNPSDVIGQDFRNIL